MSRKSWKKTFSNVLLIDLVLFFNCINAGWLPWQTNNNDNSNTNVPSFSTTVSLATHHNGTSLLVFSDFSNVPSIISSKSPSIRLLKFALEDNEKPRFQSLVMINKSFFIGSTDFIYRIDLQDLKKETTNDESSSPNDSSEIYLANNRSLRFVLYKKFQLGPYESSELCQVNNIQRQSIEHNNIRHMFFMQNILFVCGTARCGLCDGVNLELTQSRTFASENSLAKRNSDSFKPAYEALLMQLNLIASKTSSIVFFGKHRSHPVLYTGFSKDDRNGSLQVPFITSRVMQSYKNSHNKLVFGFQYTVNDLNEKSLIRVQSKDYSFNFIHGFSHNGYVYFLFTEVDSSSTSRLRIGRICENDASPLYSYMETTLQCSVFNFSVAAHLTVHLQRSEPQPDGYNYIFSTMRTDPYLIIGFNSHSSSNPFSIDDHYYSSAVCNFSMMTIEKHFNMGFQDCSTVHHFTSLLPKLNSEVFSCKEYKFDDHNDFCSYNPVNRYIDISKPIDGQVLFKIDHDYITSLGAINIDPSKHTDSTVTSLFVGTHRKVLYKFTKIDENPFQKDFSILLQEPLISQQNLTLDSESGTFYFLSRSQLLRLPMSSCSVYTSCSSCFQSKLNKVTTDWCYWHENRCYLKSFLPNHISRVQPSCPPVVYDFEPKVGSITGGTKITFHGKNFGHFRSSHKKNNPNSMMKITINGIDCSVYERQDDLTRCQLSQIDDENWPRFGNITIEVRDLLDINTRKFQIKGSLNLIDRFEFLTPSLMGVHPPFGPFVGGTKLLIYGRNLNIGSQTRVSLGTNECLLLSQNSKFLICETKSILEQSTVPIAKQIRVTIDNSDLIMNNSEEFTVDDPDQILSEENETIQRYRRQNDKFSTLTYMMLNHTEDGKFNNSFYNELFGYRFKRILKKPIFNKNFQYRVSPTVTNVKNLYTIISGNTTLDFYGDNFDSIYYPELELIFDDADLIDGQVLKLLTLCDLLSDHTKLSCLLPSLHEMKGRLRFPNSNYFIKVHYRVLLDGYVKDSRNISDDLPGQIIYHPDPSFNEMNSFETQTIWSSNRTVSLYGNNLNDGLPYQIKIDNRWLCLNPVLNKLHRRLNCIVDISDEDFDKYQKIPFNVTVQIGSLFFQIGQMSFQNDASSTIKLTMVIVTLIVFIFSLIMIMLVRMKFCKETPKESYQVIDTEMASMKKLESFFTDEMMGSKDLYDLLLSRNQIITDSKDFLLDRRLGHGEFGFVFHGWLNNKEVAVKVGKDWDSNWLLLKEIEIMKDFQHPNVMNLLFVAMARTPGQGDTMNPALIFPYMHRGDLHNFVNDPENTPRIADVLDFSKQIAKGMEYLSGLKFVHRDLAARNCLLDSKNCVKISDFGLSRFFDMNKESYYIQSNSQKLPIFWMALESLKDKKFTTKSDVWSYGILVWELFTRGKKPFRHITQQDQLISSLENGERPPKPVYVPDLLWTIICKCWLPDPEQRPTFQEITRHWEDLNDLFSKKRSQVPERSIAININSNNFQPTNWNFNEQNIHHRMDDHYQSLLEKCQINQNIDRLLESYDENQGGSYDNSALDFMGNRMHNQMDDDMFLSDQARKASSEPPPYNEATALVPESPMNYSNPAHSIISFNSPQKPFLPKKNHINNHHYNANYEINENDGNDYDSMENSKINQNILVGKNSFHKPSLTYVNNDNNNDLPTTSRATRLMNGSCSPSTPYMTNGSINSVGV